TQANTSTGVTSSANPSVFGQIVTFTATVSAALPGAGSPTGTVTFKDGATALGTVSLNGSAQAGVSTAPLAAGSHTISAVYNGDSNFASSTGSLPNNPQLVTQAGTSTGV